MYSYILMNVCLFKRKTISFILTLGVGAKCTSLYPVDYATALKVSVSHKALNPTPVSFDIPTSPPPFPGLPAMDVCWTLPCPYIHIVSRALVTNIGCTNILYPQLNNRTHKGGMFNRDCSISNSYTTNQCPLRWRAPEICSS